MDDDWDEARLKPWQSVLRQLMRYHATHSKGPLGHISSAFIPFPNYGDGHQYFIFEHSAACARRLRDTWMEIAGETVRP